MCRVCWGRGQKKGRSKEPYDAYTGKPIAELERETVNARIVEPHRKRVILEAQPDMAGEESWLIDAARYRRAGSYDDLHNALEWLRDRYPFRYEMILHWSTSHSDPWWSWSDFALSRIDNTILMLTGRMGPVVKVPSWVLRSYHTVRPTV